MITNIIILILYIAVTVVWAIAAHLSYDNVSKILYSICSGCFAFFSVTYLIQIITALK